MESSVRVGSIYMMKGRIKMEYPSLVHTPHTVSKLEALAAACQSKRGVLLEGGTCSGKTSLVCELARLTQNKVCLVSILMKCTTIRLILIIYSLLLFQCIRTSKQHT